MYFISRVDSDRDLYGESLIVEDREDAYKAAATIYLDVYLNFHHGEDWQDEDRAFLFAIKTGNWSKAWAAACALMDQFDHESRVVMYEATASPDTHNALEAFLKEEAPTAYQQTPAEAAAKQLEELDRAEAEDDEEDDEEDEDDEDDDDEDPNEDADEDEDPNPKGNEEDLD